MNQRKYLYRILQRFDMLNAKVRSTPCEQNMTVYDSEEHIDDPKYREAVGSLVYAMVATQPDLSFAQGYHSTFQDQIKVTY